MTQRKSNILKNTFFEEGGISKNAFFICFIAFLFIIIMLLGQKNENTILEINQADKDLLDLGMNLRSSEDLLMKWYKRSVTENAVKGRLVSPDKLPSVLYID